MLGQGFAYFTITMAYGKSIATATNAFASNYISNTKTVSCHKAERRHHEMAALVSGRAIVLCMSRSDRVVCMKWCELAC
jgi:hypothetical protein